MTDSIRWGLIGLGSISRKFATGLGFLPDAEVYAVASRSQEKADAFGAEFGAIKCYDNYEALANDPDVDVVLHRHATYLSHAQYAALLERR